MKKCFGGFYRRPLENALSHIVECWQLSQPLHLRHLAVVRDTAVSGTNMHYIYYSFRNFQKLVDAGVTSWEAVTFVPRESKATKLSIPPVDATPEVDEYGLPLPIPARKLVKNGDGSLLECIKAAKPLDYCYSNSDLMAIRLDDGGYGKCSFGEARFLLAVT